MKLIYFVIIILVFYIIASNVTLIHINSLPDEQKTELNNRSKIRSMLISNHVKENEHIDINDKKLLSLTSKYPNDGEVILPSSNNIIYFIKTNFMESVNFKQNNNNTTNLNISKIDYQNYINKVNQNLSLWNKLFIEQFNVNKELIVLEKLKIVNLAVSDADNLITLLMSLTYLTKLIHVKITYYFTNNAKQLSNFKLIAIDSISKQDFDQFISKTYNDLQSNLLNLNDASTDKDLQLNLLNLNDASTDKDYNTLNSSKTFNTFKENSYDNLHYFNNSDIESFGRAFQFPTLV